MIKSSILKCLKIVWVSFFRVSLLVLLQTGGLLGPSAAEAHTDAKPIWALSNQEAEELLASLQVSRQRLKTALIEAEQYGVPSQQLIRPYFYDSSTDVVDVPRSVLNRVINASLDLEIDEMKSYVFCEKACEFSLKGDGASRQQIKIIRSLWPRIQSVFRGLFQEIPTALWARVINGRSYFRSVAADWVYHSNAYGRVPIVFGATAFAVSFGISEIAESVMMGPLHVVCQANYFWSLAFASAVASLSRDLKNVVLFDSSKVSIWSRMFSIHSRFGVIRSANQFQSRVLFQTLNGFEKVSFREAVVQGRLRESLAARWVGADQLLWSELLARAEKTTDVRETRVSGLQTLFEDEIERVVLQEGGDRLWFDMHASLRTLLRGFRESIEAQHIHSASAVFELSALGQLDRSLRSMDVFVQLWLHSRTGAERTAHQVEWLKAMVREWFELSFEVSEHSTERPWDAESKREIEMKFDHFNSLLNESIRRGEPVNLFPGKRKSKVIAQTCEALFE